MKQDTSIELFAHQAQGASQTESIFRGVRITGFNEIEAEHIRALVSRVPPDLLTHVKIIRRDPTLGAKHGRYLTESETVLVNPHTFVLRQRFGKGAGWISHDELMICHEIGHSVFEFLSDVQKQEWYDLAGWVKGHPKGNDPAYVEKRSGWPPFTSDWTHKAGIRFPRVYSAKTPYENFADAFAFTLLGKEKQVDPSQVAFVKKLFHDKVQSYPAPCYLGPS